MARQHVRRIPPVQEGVRKWNRGCDRTRVGAAAPYSSPGTVAFELSCSQMARLAASRYPPD